MAELAKENPELQIVKNEISKEYLGRAGIQAVGSSEREGGKINLYVTDPGSIAFAEILPDIEKALGAFGLNIVETEGFKAQS